MNGMHPVETTPGRPSATDRVTLAFARIAAAHRPEVWIHLREQADCLDEAAAVDARVAAGETLPLSGVVIAVKDNIDVAGLPTTAGHPAFSHVPTTSATAVQRLVDAGAIVLGKTNLDQFATGLVGTRSPYGAVRAARHPDRVSGGSSSGSAVAVALGIADIGLGTDTAGSGRVPAALNGIIGIKATRGIVPVDGVVPACRSYDCLTPMARDLETAATALRIISGTSLLDPGSRPWPSDVRLSAPLRPRILVPRREDLSSLDAERLALFDEAVERLRRSGATIDTIDLSPFLDCARLLYDGALVAERYAAYGRFLAAHPEGADPSVAHIADAAAAVSGAHLVDDQDRVARYRLEIAAVLAGSDALLVPTTPEHPLLDDVAADPLGVNARLGTFTNFMNLLDLAGIAVPAGETRDGLFGVTVVVQTFDDQVALDIAASITGEPAASAVDAGVELAVFGAHLRGQPLNHELETLGARFVREDSTAPEYAMFALDGAVRKPGIVRADPGSGVSLAAEVWRVSSAGLGAFLANLPRPMALGRIRLADGEAVGFLCSEPSGEDISRYGGWVAYLEATRQGPRDPVDHDIRRIESEPTTRR